MLKSHGAAACEPYPALYVDLDTALLRTDPLLEALVRLARQHPAKLLSLPLWIARGRPALMAELARHVRMDGATVPVREDVLATLREEHAAGRRLVLVSAAADQRLVDGVAARFPIFDAALAGYAAPGPGNGLDARTGEARVDFHARTEARSPVSRALSRLRPWSRAMRPHQWAKNLLVFVPPLLSGAGTELDHWLGALAAFVMVSALASAGYVFNDLLDIDADRRHPLKRRRPFAAGDLGVRDGLVGILLLLAAAATTGLFVEPLTLAFGAVYFGTSAAYSLWLKKVPMFDVVTLAGLFTLRILIGITAAAVPMSFWLLTFSMLFFLSLAMVKRYTELREHTSPERPDLEHRGYTAADMPLLLAFGSSAAMASLTVFVVYLRDEQFDENIYTDPSLLWLVFPALTVWTMRVWHLAIHGRMHDDPILFALHDRVSHLLGVACLSCIVLAW